MMISLNRCPSTLALGYDSYSPIALKRLFDKKVVSPQLPYEPIGENREEVELFMKNKQRISLSGVQSKYSMKVKEGELRLTEDKEQVYGIETAANGLCFFENGEMAYITRRFDISPKGYRYRKEDFASLAGLTSDNAGKEYKYDRFSYEDTAELIKKYVPAWKVEILKFFRLILFNFLFCNGDAHLKNFSLMETPDGDFKLSPAYDLINTKLHVNDRIFALDKGLFKNGDTVSMPFGVVSGNTLLEWGKRIGLPEKTVKKELDKFCATYGKLDTLINNSFLSEPLKNEYRALYSGRLNSYLKV